MSHITFSLSLPAWLAQWYAHKCGNASPIRMPKGSPESIIVQRFSRRKSEAARPDIAAPGDIVIEIPENKAKPAEIYSYIAPSVKQMLYKTILSSFDLCLYEEIIRFSSAPFIRNEMIYSWMSQNEIELNETNWFAVEKRYARLRAKMLSNVRSKKSRKK